jgi:hypothetical protein
MFKKWFLISLSDPATIRRAGKRQPGSIWETRRFADFPDEDQQYSNLFLSSHS